MMKKYLILLFIFVCTSVFAADDMVMFDGTSLFYYGGGTNKVVILSGFSDFVNGTMTNDLVTTFNPAKEVHLFMESAKAQAAKQPSLDTWRGNLRAMAFDGVSEEELFFTGELPHQWQTNTDIKLHCHYDAGSAKSTNTLVFGLEIMRGNENSVWGTNVVTTFFFTNSLNSNAYHQFESDFGTLDMSGMGSSCMLKARAFRQPTNAVDNYSGKVFVHSIDYYYIVDKPAGEKGILP